MTKYGNCDECRNCHSVYTEVLFEYPNTFFWYGPDIEYFKENINPKLFNAKIIFCNKCGFMGLPLDGLLARLLKIYYSSPFSVSGATPDNESAYSLSLVSSFFKIFSDLYTGLIPEKVLEIGCQRGYLLREFLNKGSKKVIGVEPGDINPCVDNNGKRIDVRQGFFSYEIVGEENFDFVYASHVFEHVEDTNDFLQNIHRLLKPGGKLLLLVPNELFSLRDGNIGMFLFQHLNYFTPALLAKILKTNGFDVSGVISSRAESLCVMAEKRKFNDFSNAEVCVIVETKNLLIEYKEKVLGKLNLIQEISEGSKKKPLGFYGVAGAANIFSWLPELSKRECICYDSDSITWGKRYGGIPSTIKSPNLLCESDDIIVIPYRLQEEIYRLLKQENGTSPKIHKLY